jgi:hypothetical protein
MPWVWWYMKKDDGPLKEFGMKNSPFKYEITYLFYFYPDPGFIPGKGLFIYFPNNFIPIRFQSREIRFNRKI